jgi:hypothetical protein
MDSLSIAPFLHMTRAFGDLIPTFTPAFVKPEEEFSPLPCYFSARIGCIGDPALWKGVILDIKVST